MPSSNIQCIPIIVEIIRQIKPRSVLDIGTGYGKYGFLVREYVDQFKGKVEIAGFEPQNFGENWGDIVMEIYDYLYPHDFLSFDFEPEKRYDLALMIDVIEHFPKGNGYKALAKASKFAKRVLISTPRHPAPQKGKWERHLSKWTENDFFEFGDFERHSTRSNIIGVFTRHEHKTIDK